MDDSMLCPQATELVNKLFTIFYALCNGFEKQFNDPNRLKLAKAQWIIAFMEKDLKIWDQIEPAVTIFRAKPNQVYAPIVGDFLSWCNSATHEKYLSKDHAYLAAYELMRGEPCDDLDDDQLNIIKHAIKASDRHFLKSNGRNKTEPVFHRNYEIALRQFLNGELKPIPKAIQSNQVDDGRKTLKKYGVLPQYAHLNSRDKAMPIIQELLKKSGGKLGQELPYDKHKRL